LKDEATRRGERSVRPVMTANRYSTGALCA